jgi:hypothetical protein
LQLGEAPRDYSLGLLKRGHHGAVGWLVGTLQAIAGLIISIDHACQQLRTDRPRRALQQVRRIRARADVIVRQLRNETACLRNKKREKFDLQFQIAKRLRRKVGRIQRKRRVLMAIRRQSRAIVIQVVLLKSRSIAVKPERR